MYFWYLMLFCMIFIQPYECCPKCRAKKNSTLDLPTISKPSLSTNTFEIIRVADGDTVTVKNNSDKNIIRIRFKCIDAPEKSQKFGDASSKKLSFTQPPNETERYSPKIKILDFRAELSYYGELLPLHTNVTLIGSALDQYNRTLSQVVNSKGLNINKKMMELGLVVLYPGQKECYDFKDIEEKAKKAKVGVWGDPKFEMPWDYRKRMGIGHRGNLNHNNHTTTHHFHSKPKTN